MNVRASRKTSRLRLDQMLDQLRNDIINGIYPPDSYLPSESSLAEQYRISNNTVRKGLEELVEAGYIVKENRIGNRVTRWARNLHTTITLGVSPTLENDIELSELIDHFQTKYPNIQVKVLVVSGSPHYIEEGIVDVLCISQQHFQNYIETDTVHLLDPLPVNQETYPFLNKGFQYEDCLYVQPLVFSPVVLCYNKDHFAEANLFEPDSSWTWDDCLHHASLLSQASDNYGLYFYVLSENRWPAFLLQCGETFSKNAEGVCNIRGSRILSVMRLYKSIIQNSTVFPNLYMENNSEVNQLFLQGKVSMILTPYMTMNEFKHSKLHYDISPLPYLYEPLSLMITYGLAVNKNSQHKDAGRLLVNDLASYEAQSWIRKHTLTLPSNKRAAEEFIPGDEDLINRPSRYGLYRELIPSYRLHQDLNLTYSSFNTLKNLLKMYWSDLIDEETLCVKVEGLELLR